MSELGPGDFGAFFKAVYGYEPFPWQERLAAQVCGDGATTGDWPRCIALPTAAGKTACIDVAVFALACQAGIPPEGRTAPRRIFFVVDRRVVVDQAYDHAQELANKLGNSEADILRRVAAALVHIGARKDRPLDVFALRGGMYRESAWVRSPLQPTVITSTVDQVGSRLLFRGYGVSDASKPLHAALVGNDALVLLDEAHCANPFDQTMTLVRKYREWTDKPEDSLALPFHFVTMTATPGGKVPEDKIERLGDDDRMHPVLGKRIAANKPARLVVAERAKGGKWREELVKVLVEHATLFQSGDRAVGIIVNRVATARDVAAKLREEGAGGVEVILLTGRMRPVDRDAIMKKVEPLLSKNSKSNGDGMKPVFVVATQTIEVGADLDFHALVTECASLDALRQRFGRLNRVAARERAEAVIVIRADQIADSEDDPVYGSSLAKTWTWLNEHAEETPPEKPSPAGEAAAKKGKPTRGKGSGAPSRGKAIDLGIATMEERTRGMTPEELAALNAPAPDAAVLLPAHLDMWCQTSPRPAPDPDPSYFLHGPQRGEPEVQVVFRADLGDDTSRWAEIVSLCPPSSSEALSVRLSDFRRWLRNQAVDERSTDVEGERTTDENGDGREGMRRALRWRGPESPGTDVIEVHDAVTPGDTYVVPIATDEELQAAADLGDFPAGAGGTSWVTDAGDEAYQRSRDKPTLRLVPSLYPWQHSPDEEPNEDADASFDPDTRIARIVGDLAKLSEGSDDASAEPDQAVRDALRSIGDIERSRPPGEQRGWLLTSLDALLHERRMGVVPHPVPRSGWIVTGRGRLHLFDPTFIEPEDSWESESALPYELADHCRDVARAARRNAERSGLASYAATFERAGDLHDIGKADPRFQAWLFRGNRRAVSPDWLLAKSFGARQSRAERAASRIRAQYPEGGRHELHSVWMAEHNASALDGTVDAPDRGLVLHLIASHHGYCRPFAPVGEDPASQPFTYKGPEGVGALLFTPDSSAISGHGLECLDSGIAERFWTLTRRYGWWGLAYLEAVLRLADWACSEPAEPAANAREGTSSGEPVTVLSEATP